MHDDVRNNRGFYHAGYVYRRADSAPVSIANPCFVDILGEKLGVAVRNYGINGVSISKTSPTFPELAISLNIVNVEKADVLVVAAGTNDYGNDVAVGEEKDEEDISFYGGLHVLAKCIRERFSKVIFILPIKRQGEDTPNKAGHILEEYRVAMERVAKENEFFVVNGKFTPINTEKEEDRKLYIKDGLSPNEKGHQMYAE